jgi:hypothetical protein
MRVPRLARCSRGLYSSPGRRSHSVLRDAVSRFDGGWANEFVRTAARPLAEIGSNRRAHIGRAASRPASLASPRIFGCCRLDFGSLPRAHFAFLIDVADWTKFPQSFGGWLLGRVDSAIEDVRAWSKLQRKNEIDCHAIRARSELVGCEWCRIALSRGLERRALVVMNDEWRPTCGSSPSVSRPRLAAHSVMRGVSSSSSTTALYGSSMASNAQAATSAACSMCTRVSAGGGTGLLSSKLVLMSPG